jgi:hypothetical protein
MKKILNPMWDAVHKSYEKMFFYNAPRGRSKKLRRYAHVDITKEFEYLTRRREQEKEQRLEQLYEKHDLK